VTNKWALIDTTGDKPGPRCAHTCNLIKNDTQLVLTGGMSITSGKQTAYSTIYILDLGMACTYTRIFHLENVKQTA
jgi:hypothetical protein